MTAQSTSHVETVAIAAPKSAAKPEAESAKKRPKLSNVLPEIWALMRPRRWLLLFGLLLLFINRAAGLVLPLSTKFLIDGVMMGGHGRYLIPLVGGVLVATAIQAITSFALAQSLSKAAWTLITDLRIQVQAHIGRLPIAFYDSNRTGVLV